MNRNSATKALPFLSVALAATLLNGCAGYQLGSMLPDDIKTVYVPAIVNRTTEPLVEIQATQALLRELQTDGSLKIASETEADSILEVTLRRFRLQPLVYSAEDRSRPAEYSVVLTASAKLIRASTGEVLVNEPNILGDFFVPFASDLTSAKRQALPDVTRDLAHDIVEAVVEAWPETSGGGAGWRPPGPPTRPLPR